MDGFVSVTGNYMNTGRGVLNLEDGKIGALLRRLIQLQVKGFMEHVSHHDYRL